MPSTSAPRLKHLNRMRRPLVGRTIALLACFCALLVGIHGWNLWVARQGQLDVAAAGTSNMTRALAAHAETSFKVVDAVLAETVERVEHDGVNGAAGLRLHERFMHTAAQSAEVHGLFVYGPGGEWLVTSLPHPVLANNADREYFRYHQTHADRGTHVGKPVRSRSTGVLVIPVSRRIDRPDGSFGGVALVTLDLGYFGRFYDRFDVGSAGTIALALDDGTLLYRRPFNESLVGKDMGNAPIFQTMRNAGPVGTAMLTSGADGIERLYSYRRLDSYPLVVASGQAKDEILGHWWRAVVKMSSVVAFAIAMLAWGGVRMIRQVRIRERLEAELERHNQALKALAESDGLTGLANRRLFDETLARELGRARRSGSAVLADFGRRRFLQEVQRPLRPCGRRRLPAQGGWRVCGRRTPPRRPGGALRRRGIRRDPAGYRPGRRADGSRNDPRRGGGPGARACRQPGRQAQPEPGRGEPARPPPSRIAPGSRPRTACCTKPRRAGATARWRASLQLHSARSNILP
jgi:hypothetical protein